MLTPEDMRTWLVEWLWHLPAEAHGFLGFIILLWLLELLDTLALRGALNQWGIRPRRPAGLWGILWAPLLHGNLGHLMANTAPLAVLGGLILWQKTELFWTITLAIWLISGLGVWLLGRPQTNHLGASGLVFGYLGFLLGMGYFERSLMAIAIALLVGLTYSSLLWGLLPLKRGRSWTGHLFGFVGGILVAQALPQLHPWFMTPL